MDEEQLMIKYNHWITRENKAVKWFGDNPEKVNDKHIEEYHAIVRECSSLQNEYKRITGQEMQLEEKLNGFKI